MSTTITAIRIPAEEATDLVRRVQASSPFIRYGLDVSLEPYTPYPGRDWRTVKVTGATPAQAGLGKGYILGLLEPQA